MSGLPATMGMHHVSVITGASDETRRFYTEVLGLDLVKRTVNYDDQFMHHLYFRATRGGETLLTCFPAERGQQGRVGKPQPTATALAVPRGSLDDWADWLDKCAVDTGVERGDRFGEAFLRFTDGMGQPLELVAQEGDETLPSAGESVPDDAAIRGISGVTLASASPFQTASVLDALGFELVAQEGDRVRYQLPGDQGAVVDLLDADLPFGREGIGTAHHVAFRLPDEDVLTAWRELLVEDGLEPTRIKDRTYFRSVYFREPGGILIELATDGPGITVDESADALGTTLQLPRWLEEDREMITAQLPPLE